MKNPAHPGRLVASAIEAEGWTVAHAAERLDVARAYRTHKHFVLHSAGHFPRTKTVVELAWTTSCQRAMESLAEWAEGAHPSEQIPPAKA